MLRYLFIISLTILLFSCKKDISNNGSWQNLRFSNDTVIFDTTFQSIGTTTKTLKVYNRSRADIYTDISLEENMQGSFRINVDGFSGNNFENIFIGAKDSIFIFIEVTPNLSSNNFLLENKLQFNTNGNIQNVPIISPYRDAYFHIRKKNFFLNGSDTIVYRYYPINTNTVWTNDKPHVIVGDLVIEPNATLTIEAGTQIHFYENSSFYVGNPILVSSSSVPQNNGSLILNGSLGDEIIFQGYRTEEWYQDMPGQWGFIYFAPGSSNNSINHAIIKNGTTGLRADSLVSSSPVLTINNTEIKNMSAIGIDARGSSLKAYNTEISNCGLYSVSLRWGGNYSFAHCTFANYWSILNISSIRNTPSLLLNNYYEDINGFQVNRDLDEATFTNCIIYGNLVTEVSFQNGNQSNFNYQFDHCLLKLDNSVNLSTPEFINCIRNENPNFVDLFEHNFNIDSISPARYSGNSIALNEFILMSDKNGVLRTSPPDIGAYQYN